MPSLGTLVTVVTADTSGFTSGMNTAAQQAQQFSTKIKASAAEGEQSMSRWGEEVDHLGKKFTSLHGLLAIGLGVHLGRALFSEIHKGITELIGGFTEATAAGESFGDSLLAGMQKAAGLETHLEMLNRHMKENAKLAKEIGALRTTEEKILGPPAQSLSEASKTLAAMEEKQKELDATAGEWKAKISAATEQIKQAQERERQGGFSLRGTGVFSGQEALGKARREGGAAIQAAEEGQQLLDDARKDMLVVQRTAAEESQRLAEAEKEAALNADIYERRSFNPKFGDTPLKHIIGRAIIDAVNVPGRASRGIGEFFGLGGGATAGLSSIGGQFLQGIHDLKMSLTGDLQARGIHEQVETPAERALRLEKLATSLYGGGKGPLSKQDYIRQLAELRIGLGDPRGTASIGGVQDLHEQLQTAALKGRGNPQLEAIKKAIEDASKVEATALDALLKKMLPLIWEGG